MKPVLIVDCYVDGDGAENYRRLLPTKTMAVWRAIEESRPLDVSEFAAIMITGSAACVTAPEAWMGPLASVLREAGDQNLPIFGICFGHQMIAYALFGSQAVRKSGTPELGWSQIEVMHSDAIFETLESGFNTFLSHFDEVVAQPGMMVLARSERCGVQSYRVEGRPIWGVQFHAEIEQAEAERLLAIRIGGRPDLGFDLESKLQEGKDSTGLAKKIMGNFFAAVS
jgi:GMP synthase-like glutamine amidotransferase